MIRSSRFNVVLMFCEAIRNGEVRGFSQRCRLGLSGRRVAAPLVLRKPQDAGRGVIRRQRRAFGASLREARCYYRAPFEAGGAAGTAAGAAGATGDRGVLVAAAVQAGSRSGTARRGPWPQLRGRAPISAARRRQRRPWPALERCLSSATAWAC